MIKKAIAVVIGCVATLTFAGGFGVARADVHTMYVDCAADVCASGDDAGYAAGYGYWLARPAFYGG